MAAISLPREHGAYLTLGGSIAAALVVAPDRLAAAGVAGIAVAGFFGRAIVERGAVGAATRRADVVWGAALIALAVGGERLAARGDAVLALVLAGALGPALIATALVRRARLQRAIAVEQLGLGALGGVAGIAAWFGGSTAAVAAALGAVLAAHASSSVPLVRAVVRGQHPPPGLVLGVGALAAGLVVALTMVPLAAFALAPRIVQTVVLVRPPRARVAPRVVGLRETAVLAVVVAGACAAALRA